MKAAPPISIPRVGIDAQSERIDELLFDALLTRDEHFNVQPGLAERWEIPDPLTYIFHLHRGVTFHDGRPLTSRDVKWTFDSLLQGKIRSAEDVGLPLRGSHRSARRLNRGLPSEGAVRDLAVESLRGAIGIVPYGIARRDHAPIRSAPGPFKFVSAEQDKEVMVERNDAYWGAKPRLARVRFAVVPDATTRALELRKGSADLAINALTADMVAHAREREPNLVVQHAPGPGSPTSRSICAIPILKDVRVRQAIAYAIDRRPMIQYLWRDMARPAASMLPPQSWAYDDDVAHYDHDPGKARQIARCGGLPGT